MTPEGKAIAAEIEQGYLDSDLFELKDAIERRVNVRLSKNSGPFAPGERVRFASHIRPAKLAGRTAIIVHTNGKGRNRIVVDLEQPVDRWNKGIRCQESHLEPLAA